MAAPKKSITKKLIEPLAADFQDHLHRHLRHYQQTKIPTLRHLRLSSLVDFLFSSYDIFQTKPNSQKYECQYQDSGS